MADACPMWKSKLLKKQNKYEVMQYIIIKNITKNNLKDFSVKIPLQKLVVIVGPSGSGKTTLAHNVLYDNSIKNEWDIENLPKKVDILEQKVILPKDSKLSLGEFNLNKLKTKLSAMKRGDLLIIDEPCAGFCKKEREMILKMIKEKVAQEYSIIAIEHNKEIIAGADYIIELGPGAGRYGGKLIFEGTMDEFKKSDTMTAKHIFNENEISYNQRDFTKNKVITISKINAGCFKNYSFSFPLKNIVCITGCSGAGKSTLLDVVYRALFKGKNAWKIRLKSVNVSGKTNVRRSFFVPQTPIGNHSSSTLWTYTKIGKGRDIKDIMNLTIDEALEIFKENPLIVRKLHFLQEVGLGYLTLGQKSNSLSGGEAQRVRMAKILSKKLGDRTVYIFDTPSRGLYFNDLPVLIKVFRKIVEKNNTILIADNREEIFKYCDYQMNL